MSTEVKAATNKVAVTTQAGTIPILASGASDRTAAMSRVALNQPMFEYCSHFFAGFCADKAHQKEPPTTHISREAAIASPLINLVHKALVCQVSPPSQVCAVQVATNPTGRVEIAYQDGCWNRCLPATKLADNSKAHVHSQVEDNIAGAKIISVMADSRMPQTAPIMEIVLLRDRSLNDVATPASAMHAGMTAIAMGSHACLSNSRR